MLESDVGTLYLATVPGDCSSKMFNEGLQYVHVTENSHKHKPTQKNCLILSTLLALGPRVAQLKVHQVFYMYVLKGDERCLRWPSDNLCNSETMMESHDHDKHPHMHIHLSLLPFGSIPWVRLVI